jgi:hypothetical protein
MTPGLRKLALTAHVTFSVGWLGAVAGFLALSIAGATSRNTDVVRSAYLAMDLIGQFVIVPMSLATLATGLIQALGTEWGLFRSYWVLVKFMLTMGAIIVLLLHQFTAVAGAARRVTAVPAGALPNVGRLAKQLIGDASLAVLVLLGATILSVYKPWGLTRYGRRKQRERRRVQQQLHNETTCDGVSLGLKIAFAVLGVMLAVFVVLHLTGHGLHGH